MPKPFDATTKQLVAIQPEAWLGYLGLSGAPVEVIEADLATVTAEADQVLRVAAPVPYLAHLEFQASYDPAMGRRLLRYNVLLHYRHGLPVHSVVLLLRPQADGPAMTGRVGYAAGDDLSLHFRYRVLRVWEKDVGEILSGGRATLPLAPLAAVSADALPGVVREMEARIEREAPPAEAGMLWTATYVLMGLRYPEAFTAQLLKGVRQMKESVTYQAILAEGEAKGKAEGRAEEARRLILRQGTKRFGAPGANVEAAIAGVGSVEQLEQLAERLLEVESWDELLA